MEKINSEILISSLFNLGFDKVDTALFTHTLGKISTADVSKKFIFEDDKFSDTFEKYVTYDGSVFKLKEGYTLNTNVSQIDGFVWPIKEALKTNICLMNCLSNLDFKEIVLKKAQLYGYSAPDQIDDDIFSSKEIEILKGLGYRVKLLHKKNNV